MLSNLYINIILHIILIFTYSQTISQSTVTNRYKRGVFLKSSQKWPNGIIPYRIDSIHFDANQTNAIIQAIDSWNEETCVQFVPAISSDKSWLNITNGYICYSTNVGMGYHGEQSITLPSPSCASYGMALHELGHVIGLGHEHSRKEIDDYFDVDEGRINPHLRSNFDKYPLNETETFGLPYDLQSVMHYLLNLVSTDYNKPAVKFKDPKLEHVLGDINQKDLSFWDVKSVNLYYECNKHCKKDIPCKSPGFINKHCKCQTPEEFTERRCYDTFDTSYCENLAKHSECYLNKNFMNIGCRKTCSHCYQYDLDKAGPNYNQRCQDHLYYCNDLAANGYCEKDPYGTTFDCPLSCGVCKPKDGSVVRNVTHAEDCVNIHPSEQACFDYKNEGLCETHEAVRYHCARTCNVC